MLVDQFIDRTFAREKSFFGTGCVAHVSLADPVSPLLADAIEAAARSEGGRMTRGGTYLVIEGPQFSTRAESHLYRAWGCDVIGMTNMPEAKLAREAEICYATVAMVTDYDCWHDDHAEVDVAAVIRVLRQNVDEAQRLIARLATDFPREHPPCPIGSDRALDVALITAPEARDPALLTKLDAVAGRVLTAEGPERCYPFGKWMRICILPSCGKNDRQRLTAEPEQHGEQDQGRDGGEHRLEAEPHQMQEGDLQPLHGAGVRRHDPRRRRRRRWANAEANLGISRSLPSRSRASRSRRKVRGRSSSAAAKCGSGMPVLLLHTNVRQPAASASRRPNLHTAAFPRRDVVDFTSAYIDPAIWPDWEAEECTCCTGCMHGYAQQPYANVGIACPKTRQLLWLRVLRTTRLSHTVAA